MASIEIDVGVDIDEKSNITAYVYAGEGSCEPVLGEFYSLQTLIESLLQAYIIPGEGKIAPYHLEESEQLVKSLKAATKYAKKRIKELS